MALSQSTTYRWSFVEDVLGCQRAGLRRLGVWRRKLDDFGLDLAVELLRDHRLSASSLSWAGGFTGGNGLTFDEAVEDARQAASDAAAIGARTLTIVSGPRAGHIYSHSRRLLSDGLAATVDVAAEYGVILALQPMAALFTKQWTFLDSLAETLDVVSTFDHPFLGIALGSYHVWHEPKFVETLRAAAPFIATVQLSDWRPTRLDCDRHVPGDGLIPLPEIVNALTSGGYRGDFEIDVWSQDLWRSDYDTLLATCVRRCASLLPKSATALPVKAPTPTRD